MPSRHRTKSRLEVSGGRRGEGKQREQPLLSLAHHGIALKPDPRWSIRDCTTWKALGTSSIDHCPLMRFISLFVRCICYEHVRSIAHTRELEGNAVSALYLNIDELSGRLVSRLRFSWPLILALFLLFCLSSRIPNESSTISSKNINLTDFK